MTVRQIAVAAVCAVLFAVVAEAYAGGVLESLKETVRTR